MLLGVASSPSRGEEQRRHSDFCPHTCQEAGVCLWTLSLLPGPLFASLIYNSKKARRPSCLRTRHCHWLARAPPPGEAKIPSRLRVSPFYLFIPWAGPRGTYAKRWHDAAPLRRPEPGHLQAGRQRCLLKPERQRRQPAVPDWTCAFYQQQRHGSRKIKSGEIRHFAPVLAVQSYHATQPVLGLDLGNVGKLAMQELAAATIQRAARRIPQSECSICLGPCDKLITWPSVPSPGAAAACKHGFCRRCLTAWLRATKEPRRPMCRAPASSQAPQNVARRAPGDILSLILPPAYTYQEEDAREPRSTTLPSGFGSLDLAELAWKAISRGVERRLKRRSHRP